MNIFRSILLSCLFLVTLSGYGQKDIAIPVNQRVILNYPDFTVYANVLVTENKVRPEDELYYYWFSANDIKRTRGGFDGKLLHGIYTEFYLNKNLKEKGQFRFGLKHKEWKSWHINGEYKEISYWKKGKQQGRCRYFSEDGKLAEERVYRNGLLHGKSVIYLDQDSPQIRKYRKGELVKEKTGKKNAGGKKKIKVKGSAEDPAGLPADTTGTTPATSEKKKASGKTSKTEKQSKPGKAENEKEPGQERSSRPGNTPGNRGRKEAAEGEKERQSQPAKERNAAGKKKKPE